MDVAVTKLIENAVKRMWSKDGVEEYIDGAGDEMDGFRCEVKEALQQQLMEKLNQGDFSGEFAVVVVTGRKPVA